MPPTSTFCPVAVVILRTLPLFFPIPNCLPLIVKPKPLEYINFVASIIALWDLL